MGAGTLEVTILGATGLRDAQLFGRQDPYAVIHCGKTHFRTKTCTDGGKRPTWNERFQVAVPEGVTELDVVVWNDNMMTSDDCIASGTMSLTKVLDAKHEDIRVQLATKDGRPSGEVSVILIYTPDPPEAKAEATSAAQHGLMVKTSSRHLQQPPATTPGGVPAHVAPASLNPPPRLSSVEFAAHSPTAAAQHSPGYLQQSGQQALAAQPLQPDMQHPSTAQPSSPQHSTLRYPSSGPAIHAHSPSHLSAAANYGLTSIIAPAATSLPHSPFGHPSTTAFTIAPNMPQRLDSAGAAHAYAANSPMAYSPSAQYPASPFHASAASPTHQMPSAHPFMAPAMPGSPGHPSATQFTTHSAPSSNPLPTIIPASAYPQAAALPYGSPATNPSYASQQSVPSAYPVAPPSHAIPPSYGQAQYPGVSGSQHQPYGAHQQAGGAFHSAPASYPTYPAPYGSHAAAPSVYPPQPSVFPPSGQPAYYAPPMSGYQQAPQPYPQQQYPQQPYLYSAGPAV